MNPPKLPDAKTREPLTILQADYPASAATINKLLTVWRFSHSYLSFDGCNAAFRAHPEWRSV